MLTDVLLLLSRALLDSEGLRIDKPTTKKTSSAFFLGNIVFLNTKEYLFFHVYFCCIIIALLNSDAM